MAFLDYGMEIIFWAVMTFAALLLLMLFYLICYWLVFPFRILYRVIFHRIKTKEAIKDIKFEDYFSTLKSGSEGDISSEYEEKDNSF